MSKTPIEIVSGQLYALNGSMFGPAEMIEVAREFLEAMSIPETMRDADQAEDAVKDFAHMDKVWALRKNRGIKDAEDLYQRMVAAIDESIR